MKLHARTDFREWSRESVDKFAREAADALHQRNEDAARFVLLANIALNRDDVAAAKLNVICPDPQNLDELRHALDAVLKEEL
jgi:protein required for attachment to host cells